MGKSSRNSNKLSNHSKKKARKRRNQKKSLKRNRRHNRTINYKGGASKQRSLDSLNNLMSENDTEIFKLISSSSDFDKFEKLMKEIFNELKLNKPNYTRCCHIGILISNRIINISQTTACNMGIVNEAKENKEILRNCMLYKTNQLITDRPDPKETITLRNEIIQFKNDIDTFLTQFKELRNDDDLGIFFDQLNNIGSRFNISLTNFLSEKKVSDKSNADTFIDEVLKLIKKKEQTFQLQAAEIRIKCLYKLLDILITYSNSKKQRKEIEKILRRKELVMPNIDIDNNIPFGDIKIVENCYLKETRDPSDLITKALNGIKSEIIDRTPNIKILIQNIIHLLKLGFSIQYIKDRIPEQNYQEITDDLLDIIFSSIDLKNMSSITADLVLLEIKNKLQKNTKMKYICFAYIDHIIKYLTTNHPQANILLSKFQHPSADRDKVTILNHINTSFQMLIGIPENQIKPVGSNIVITTLLELPLTQCDIAKSGATYFSLFGFSDEQDLVALAGPVLMPNSIKVLYPQYIHEIVQYLFNYDEYEYDHYQPSSPIYLRFNSIIRNIFKHLSLKTDDNFDIIAQLLDINPAGEKPPAAAAVGAVKVEELEGINNKLFELLCTIKLLYVTVLIYFYFWMDLKAEGFLNTRITLNGVAETLIRNLTIGNFLTYLNINGRPTLPSNDDCVTYDSLLECLENMLGTIRTIQIILDMTAGIIQHQSP